MAMKSVIVATSDNSVFSTIRSVLRSEFQIVQAQNLLRCQQLFRSRYRELTFIDLALLNEAGQGAGLRGHCRRVFTDMRKLYPTAGLIAMAPKKSIITKKNRCCRDCFNCKCRSWFFI